MCRSNDNGNDVDIATRAGPLCSQAIITIGVLNPLFRPLYTFVHLHQHNDVFSSHSFSFCRCDAHWWKKNKFFSRSNFFFIYEFVPKFLLILQHNDIILIFHYHYKASGTWTTIMIYLLSGATMISCFIDRRPWKKYRQ